MWTAIAAGRRRLAPALLLLLAAAAAEPAGCGGARPVPQATRRQEEAARAGARAYRRGDLAGAVAAREEALLAARSVEDVAGVAAALLDLAALHREAGAPGSAADALAELLAEPPPLPFGAAARADAAFLAALLAVDAGDHARGRVLAERSRGLCREARCPDEAARVNLLARIDLLGGDADAAVRRAHEALGLLRWGGDREERANSHRLLGDAELARGRPGEAAGGYARALETDRELGLADKVFVDLLGLGRAATARGRPEEAAAWLRRARAAALAAGDAAGARRAESLLPPAPRD